MAGVKIAFGDAVPLNCAKERFGPAAIDQLPVPAKGVFADKEKGLKGQPFWSGPADVAVGTATKVTCTSSTLAGQGAFDTVQRKV